MKQDLLTSVVVATDFSEGGRLAFDRALRLPLHPKAEVLLVHAVPDDIPGRLRKQAISESKRALDALLEKAQVGIEKAGLKRERVTAEVLEGSVAKQVVKRARAQDADVIVIGRHGRRPLVDLFVGSTAQKIARLGERPVLLVQLEPTTEYRLAVAGLAVNTKPAAVLRATQLLSPGCATRAVHGFVPPYEDYVAVVGEPAHSLSLGLMEDAQRVVKQAITKSGVPAVPIVRAGDPRSVLLEDVAKEGAQLLVLGTHASPSIKRLFLGSVTEWVLGHARCDVLVVPT